MVYHLSFQVFESESESDSERELETEVTKIVRPSRLPGSKFMEELLVRMSTLVVLQLATPDPTMTSEMQVQLVYSYLLVTASSLLVTPEVR